tara:strand:- start:329 stop:451 length:123 start_codon:yes stop_codon:yes gene_type:complete
VARINFKEIVVREKPKKRKGRHAKSPNKSYTKKKYRGQGR